MLMGRTPPNKKDAPPVEKKPVPRVEPEKGERAERWILQGRVLLTGDEGKPPKLGQRWSIADEDGKPRSMQTFVVAGTEMGRPYAEPGAVFDVVAVFEDGNRKSVYAGSGTKGPEFVRERYDGPELVEWATNDATAGKAVQMHQVAARTLSVDVIDEALRPILRAYRKASSFQRAAIIAMVISRIEDSI